MEYQFRFHLQQMNFFELHRQMGQDSAESRLGLEES
jgi:hypothetical protein